MFDKQIILEGIANDLKTPIFENNLFLKEL